MKCPKCAYLGFETGDRCKNCGYDFSLLSAPESDSSTFDQRFSSDEGEYADRMFLAEPQYVAGALPVEDVLIHKDDDARYPDPWLGGEGVPLDVGHRTEPSSGVTVDDPLTISALPRYSFADDDGQLRPGVDEKTDAGRGMALPLFAPSDADDEPLIKLPATPRAPLAVRRGPDLTRLRAVPKSSVHPPSTPALQFSEDLLGPSIEIADGSARRHEYAPTAITGDFSGAGARMLGAAIDCAILLGIDLGVVYFTVRMAGLSMGEWTVLPFVPMLTFLGLLKVAYFYAFTAVGGQTIGKMAAGTRVIADDGAAVDAARAMRRTCAAILSFLPLGLGYLPAVFGERRALHDRLAGTRVVRFRSA
jgi:uncharacterized RDD family membrane protein YckC